MGGNDVGIPALNIHRSLLFLQHIRPVSPLAFIQKFEFATLAGLGGQKRLCRRAGLFRDAIAADHAGDFIHAIPF